MCRGPEVGVIRDIAVKVKIKHLVSTAMILLHAGGQTIMHNTSTMSWQRGDSVVAKELQEALGRSPLQCP